jgi:excisionase family DNA binding protein
VVDAGPNPTELLSTKLGFDTVSFDLAHSNWQASDRPMLAEPWVSVDDVARHLGVAKDSVYRWIETHGIPAHRIGRLWKFKLTEVDDWVRAGGADTRGDQAEGDEAR